MKINMFHKNIAFLLCEFAYVPLNMPSVKMKSYTLGSNTFFPLYVFLYDAPNLIWKWKSIYFTRIWFLSSVVLHISHQIWAVSKGSSTCFRRVRFVYGVCSHFLPNLTFVQKKIHIFYKSMLSLQCVFPCFTKGVLFIYASSPNFKV